MADLTYNQGIHGAQDQANALVRAGMPFSVITGDWRSDEFARAFGDWARAAQAVTALRRHPDRAARLSDERDGRHPLRPAGAAAPARADDRQRGPGRPGGADRRRVRRRRRRADRRARASASRSRPTCRASATPTPPGSSWRSAAMLEEGGYAGLLVPLRLDRRRRPLPAAAAAGRLGPDGRRLRLRRRGRHEHGVADVRRAGADRRRPLQRDVRDGLGARLGADQPHGRGQLADRAERPPGPADRPRARASAASTTRRRRCSRPSRASPRRPRWSPLEGEYYRLVVGRGEVLDTPELPKVEMHYFHFRPERGHGARSWTSGCTLGAPHHFVINLGDHVARWRRFAELLELDYEEI